MVRPDAGTIRVFGLDHRRDEKAVKSQIGVVLDESLFHEALTPAQVGKSLRRIYPNWDRRCYETYLKKFDLPETAPIQSFSRGMKMNCLWPRPLPPNRDCCCWTRPQPTGPGDPG